ncbi:MAG: DUF4214 domain-containing protein [Lachnospiraceae bacterium]|nr:DUF4214 domain-containing protein [Lachnospiraceae bacterium]
MRKWNLRKDWKKYRALLLALFFMIATLDYSFFSEAAGANGIASSNVGNHSYTWNTANVPNSYLTFYNGLYIRVEAIGQDLVIESYDSNYELRKTKTIPFELPIFGGFYSGHNAYYVMYGQENLKESNDVEVIRIVKYDWSWKRLGSVSFKGINTSIPFKAGSSSFAEYGNCLYVRTCHQMYKSSDGLNHQANLTFVIDSANMVAKNAYYGVSYVGASAGYTSHSFNQFIRVAGNRVLAVDHGDAYPRSIELQDFGTVAGGDSLGAGPVSLLDIPGAVGDNYTGTSIGGFEVSESNSLTAIARVKFDNNFKNNKIRNISILTLGLGNTNASSVREIVFTNLAEDSDVTNGNPILVNAGPNRFVLMWGLYHRSGYGYYGAATGKFQAVLLDGNGNAISRIETFNGYLSDCQPVYGTGKVIWYVTGVTGDETVPCFYELDVGNNSLSFTQKLTGLVFTRTISELQPNATYQFQASKVPDSFDGAIIWKSSNESIATISGDGLVTAIKPGTTIISVSCSGKSISHELTVPEIPVSGVYINAYHSSVAVGDTITLGGTIYPSNATGNVSLRWSSSDETIATVADDGVVTGKKAGAVTISCSVQGKSDNISILVYEDYNYTKKPVPNITPSSDGSYTDPAMEFVARMYRVVLNREPDDAGLIDWTMRLKKGQAAAVDIVQGFFWSDEYKNMAKPNGEIVTDCYNAMLGRDPDEGGYNDWVTKLDNGMSVNAIFAGFVGSQEFANLCNSYGIQPGNYDVSEPRDQNQGVTAFVARLYTQALGRGYDVDGLNDWTGQINANPSRENVLYVSTTGFLDSQEFVNKNLDNTEYVKVLYRTYLGREYDDDGLADWVGQLDRGENTRDGVAAGFAYSQEFTDIMAQYGL